MMKSTTFVAVLLVLLSLLLVIGAATLFLLQGRRTLLEETESLESQLQSQNMTHSQLQTTVDAQAAALQTQEASLSQSLLQLATRDAQLTEAQTAAEAATQGAAQATLEATPTPEPQVQEEGGPPVLDILSPTNGVSVASDSPIPLIVVAFTSMGVERIEVEISDRQETLTESGNGETYAVMNRRVFDPMPGPLTITATLTTIDSQSIHRSIQILVNSPAEPNGTEDDTQGLLSAPVADLRR